MTLWVRSATADGAVGVRAPRRSRSQGVPHDRHAHDDTRRDVLHVAAGHAVRLSARHWLSAVSLRWPIDTPPWRLPGRRGLSDLLVVPRDFVRAVLAPLNRVPVGVTVVGLIVGNVMDTASPGSTPICSRSLLDSSTHVCPFSMDFACAPRHPTSTVRSWSDTELTRQDEHRKRPEREREHRALR